MFGGPWSQAPPGGEYLYLVMLYDFAYTVS